MGQPAIKKRAPTSEPAISEFTKEGAEGRQEVMVLGQMPPESAIHADVPAPQKIALWQKIWSFMWRW